MDSYAPVIWFFTYTQVSRPAQQGQEEADTVAKQGFQFVALSGDFQIHVPSLTPPCISA